MTRDQFIYALTACGCLLKYDKTWYEHNELIKCFEDLGLFDEQETKNCSDCEIVQGSIKSISRVLYEKDEALDMIKEEIGYLRTFNPYTVAFQRDVLNVIDKYKTESEGENMNMDYSKAFELLNQDAEKERNKKAEKAVHDNLYNKGFRDGLAVLDKVRAEIEQNAYPIVHGVNNHELGMTLYGILQVIDKYKAESEKA